MANFVFDEFQRGFDAYMEGSGLTIPKSDTIHAFNCMLLVQMVDEANLSGLVVVGNLDGIRKGIVVDVGDLVPELQKGDQIYAIGEHVIELEDGMWAVHFEEVIAYKRYE